MYVLNIINFPLEGNQRKEERKKERVEMTNAQYTDVR